MYRSTAAELSSRQKARPAQRRDGWRHLPLSVLAVAVLLGSHTLPAQAPDPSVQQAIQRGAAAMRAGNASEAETAFRHAIELSPNLPETHLDLALVLAREGRLQDAIDELHRALAINPNLPSAHMFAGIFLSQTNRPDQGASELRLELASDPNNVEALTWLGMIELAQSHPERAVPPLDHAAELAPNDLNILEYRGRAHREVARDSYSRMARIDPSSWHVHRVQGELYAEEGKHAEAVSEFEAAVAQMPSNPDLFEELGDEYRKLNQLDPARKAFEKELKLSPTNPIAQYELGSAEVELGDSAAGVPLLKSMLGTFPGAPVAEYYLGRGLAAEGKNEEAASWLEKSARSDGGQGEVAKRSFYELGRLYRKMQRPADADHAAAEYNRIRLAEEKGRGQGSGDWRKLPPPAGSPTPPTE